jgi:hypothetical protein
MAKSMKYAENKLTPQAAGQNPSGGYLFLYSGSN